MTISTVDLEIKEAGALTPVSLNIPVKATTFIGKGCLVSQLISGGMAVPYSTASSGPAVGVAQHGQTGGVADGDKRIIVANFGIWIFDNGTSSDEVTEATQLGAVLYGTDDHTVALTSNAGARKPIGFFAGLEPADPAGVTRVRVLVLPFAEQLADLASDVGALTLTAVAGAASNGTLVAMPNPTDTPASADALRDDIVAVLLPSIRDNVLELGDQINAIRTSLRNAGIMA
jgi:hypothetical protein